MRQHQSVTSILTNSRTAISTISSVMKHITPLLIHIRRCWPISSAIYAGSTATPERMDDNTVILDIFKKTAHKLDIQTAVEIGELVPVRCIRIHTNIDLTKIRFNSVQYNIRDLEARSILLSRNKLIVDTWLQYVKIGSLWCSVPA